jgi:hypothetical protein
MNASAAREKNLKNHIFLERAQATYVAGCGILRLRSDGQTECAPVRSASAVRWQ